MEAENEDVDMITLRQAMGRLFEDSVSHARVPRSGR